MTTYTEYAISIHGHQPRPEDHLHVDELDHVTLGPGEQLVTRQVTDWQPAD